MKLEPNVMEFLNKASNVVGRFEGDSFNQDMFCRCTEIGIESPIERLLYVAILSLAKLQYINEAQDPFEDDGEWHNLGLHISPQKKIGRYRVDFQVSHEKASYKTGKRTFESKAILVECDSQQFHERTERERRYEKQRDRYFASLGLTILHFTGSEIFNDPWRPAAEILQAVYGNENTTAEDFYSDLENYLD